MKIFFCILIVSMFLSPTLAKNEQRVAVLKTFDELSKLNYSQKIKYILSVESVARSNQFEAFNEAKYFSHRKPEDCSFYFFTHKSDCRPLAEAIVKFFANSENVSKWNVVRTKVQLKCSLKKQCEQLKKAIANAYALKGRGQ